MNPTIKALEAIRNALLELTLTCKNIPISTPGFTSQCHQCQRRIACNHIQELNNQIYILKKSTST